MKSTRAEFVTSAVAPGDFPGEGRPEVVLAGRSNVGKSSLINRLVGAKGLARTSSTPGKTQTINFYRLDLNDDAFYLVDLPGFGYAKASKTAARQWGRLIEQYFQDRPCIALVIHLIDSRIPPTASDLKLHTWLQHIGVPDLVVATKVDKMSRNERTRQLRAISSALAASPVLAASSVTGEGCREIWQRVAEAAHAGAADRS